MLKLCIPLKDFNFNGNKIIEESYPILPQSSF